MLIHGTPLWHLCCSFLPWPLVAVPLLYVNYPRAELAEQCMWADLQWEAWSCSIGPCVTATFILMQLGSPRCFFSAHQAQQSSGDRPWGQGGGETPQVATSGCYGSWYPSPVKQFSAIFVACLVRRQHVEQQSFRALGSYNSKSVSSTCKQVVCHLET